MLHYIYRPGKCRKPVTDHLQLYDHQGYGSESGNAGTNNTCAFPITLYRMQEKPQEELKKGDTVKASRHFNILATHLISKGERELPIPF